MRILFLLCMLLPVMAHAQFTDDFSDGNFTANPGWVGDTSHFRIDDGQLRLWSEGNDTIALATASTRVAATEWSFWLKLSFNTSAGNHARVYLAADTASLQHVASGYYLRAGGSDDSLVLMLQQGGTDVPLYTFKNYRTNHSTNTLRFRFRCDAGGDWEAWIDTTGGKNFRLDGSFSDKTVTNSVAAGVWCRFTSSNATKMYFDDFYAGPVIYDTLPPVITKVEVPTPDMIRIRYSEVPESVSALNSEHYRLLPAGIKPAVVGADPADPQRYLLHFPDSLSKAFADSLEVRGIADPSGNIMPDTVFPVCYYAVKEFDVVISEILADPEPAGGLPPGEFLELFNRTQKPISLEGWQLKAGSYTKTFPEITIAPEGYLLVAKDSAYRSYGSCALIFTSASTLSNEGTAVVLKDRENHIIHTVNYSPEWFRGSFKEEGGWSLEMTDPGNPCGCMENWGASRDESGGTPGRKNSLDAENPDESPPELLRAAPADSVTLLVVFSEPVDSVAAGRPQNWVAGPGETSPDSVITLPPDYSKFKLLFGNPFEKGQIYTLRNKAVVMDCAGNQADSLARVRFARPLPADWQDLVINELLAEPYAGGARFIELFNRSEKVLDLSTLVLASGDTLALLTGEANPLSSENILFFPGDYAVFTPSPGDVRSRYHVPFPDRLFRMDRFPAFQGDEGMAVIATKGAARVTDCFGYTAGMHFPLLISTRGVSLERLNPDRPASDSANWHSAAATAGYATPGYLNSQWFETPGSGPGVSVVPKVFSPDNDGRDDVTTVCFEPEGPGFMVRIDIYDASGRMVATLSGNTTVSGRDCFNWDGRTRSGGIAGPGIYIIVVQWVNPGGQAGSRKLTTVVAWGS